MKTLCRINGLSCFGCCIDKWKNKKIMLEGIKENTKRKTELKSFFNKGVCQHIIKQGKHFGCRIHPTSTGDERRGFYHRKEWYCDLGYQCKTNKEFMSWSVKKQNQFLRFIEKQNLDSYDYSEGIYKGDLLKRFKESIV